MKPTQTTMPWVAPKWRKSRKTDLIEDDRQITLFDAIVASKKEENHANP